MSICCAAYQHEKFIEQAVDSFLMQETTFPVQIILHDDASKDNTPQIISRYARRFPQCITAIFQSENIFSEGGLRGLRVQFLSCSTGEFIAQCEGDDYWITPDKLEQQVAMLKKYPHCQMSMHAVVDVNVDGKPLPKPEQPRPRPGLIAQGGFFRKECEHWQTAAFVFRKNFIIHFPDWLHHLAFGDVPLLALASLRGPICCIPGTHSAYRIHHGGVYSNTTLESDPMQSLRKNMRWDGEFAKMFRSLINETEDPFWIQFFKAKATEHARSVIWSARLMGDYREVRKSIADAIQVDPAGVLKDMNFWKNALFALTPWLDFKHSAHLKKFTDTFKQKFK